jgi:hypothetical protein
VSPSLTTALLIRTVAGHFTLSLDAGPRGWVSGLSETWKCLKGKSKSQTDNCNFGRHAASPMLRQQEASNALLVPLENR